MAHGAPGGRPIWPPNPYPDQMAYPQLFETPMIHDDLSQQQQGILQPIPSRPAASVNAVGISPDSRRADRRARPPVFSVTSGDASPSPPIFDANTEVTERTASGLPISRGTMPTCASTELLDDMEAADRVVEHVAEFRQRHPDSKHERILRALIHPRTADAEYAIDDDALGSIFSAANQIFFHGRLTQRVRWDWSSESNTQYYAMVVGTTAMRRSPRRGLETLIVLSSPILTDTRFNRRLVISTFLHELIHCYLFVCCGARAKRCGGHTPGFKAIAEVVDNWAGRGVLHLRDMEAPLARFLVGGEGGSPHAQEAQNNVHPLYPDSYPIYPDHYSLYPDHYPLYPDHYPAKGRRNNRGAEDQQWGRRARPPPQ